MRRILLLLVVLGMAPLTAAEDLHLHLSESFEFASATLIAGHIDIGPASLESPVFFEAKGMLLAAGTLRVCPLRDGEEVGVRSALPTPSCGVEQTFLDPRIEFGNGTNLAFNGTYHLERMPAATLSLATAGPNHKFAFTMSPDGVLLRPMADILFVPTSSRAVVTVIVDDERHVFEGTEYAFKHNGRGAVVNGTAGGGTLRAQQAASGPQPINVTVGPSASSDLLAALQPFALLEIQELLLGPDARERRASVVDVMREYGRSADLVNGAFFGNLNGTAGKVAFAVGEPSLIRLATFNGTMDGNITGTFTPDVIATSSSTALGAGSQQQPPWASAAVLWMLAAAVVAVRRHRIVKLRQVRLVSAGMIAVGFLCFDWLVMDRHFGAGAMRQMATAFTAGGWPAVLAFEIIAVTAAWVLLMVPVRMVLVRILEPRPAAIALAILAGVWLVAMALAPATFFSLGHALARV